MKKILIIDDDEPNQRLFKAILSARGYRAIQAGNGADGIRSAKEDLPDLILMDIQMPEIDGIEAFGILQSDPSTKSIPVIALTSHAMRGDRERLLAVGFRDYIAKPIDVSKFVKLIDSHC